MSMFKIANLMRLASLPSLAMLLVIHGIVYAYASLGPLVMKFLVARTE